MVSGEHDELVAARFALSGVHPDAPPLVDFHRRVVPTKTSRGWLGSEATGAMNPALSSQPVVVPPGQLAPNTGPGFCARPVENMSDAFCVLLRKKPWAGSGSARLATQPAPSPVEIPVQLCAPPPLNAATPLSCK